MGGENWTVRSPVSRLRGSSPRGRGKHSRRHPKPRRGRLIPAWAGKTEYMHATYPDAQAHPRVGGENQDENIINLSKQGSSPRGRGKLPIDCHAGCHARLIPAWAGKTPEA